MKLANLSIGTRLYAGFVVVLGLCGALALVAWLQVQRIGAIVTDIDHSWVVSVVRLDEMNDALSNVRRSELRSVLAVDPKVIDAEEAYRVEQFERLEAEARPYEATGISGPPEQKLYDQFRADLQSCQQRLTTLLPLLTGVAAIVLTLIVIVAVSLLFAWRVTRSIVSPLHAAIGVARNIATGDLSRAVETTAKDETGQLLAALGDMQTKLRSTLPGIQESADQVDTASTQIASGNGNGDLSARTEQQASTLQETVSSVEQLMTTVTHSARSVAVLISGVSTAASEQTSGIRLVNTSVNDLDKTTQQNAALVEESAAAAESLKEQALHLSRAVNQFKLTSA